MMQPCRKQDAQVGQCRSQSAPHSRQRNERGLSRADMVYGISGEA